MTEATRATAREKVLNAARRVFAQHGPVGATTRRIADEAGVNEVTIFRLFGSKDALLEEAARVHATGEHALPLPEDPRNPVQELTVWCAREIQRLRESREFILQCLAVEPERPALAETGALPMEQSAQELNGYVDRLLAKRAARHPEDRVAATTMLLATIYSDALGRAALPNVHRVPEREAAGAYARLFLRLLGITAR